MYLVKMQHAYSHLLVFIDDFCIYVDFYFLLFRQFNTGPMTLPTDDMQQCHPFVAQCMKVDTKVIPHTKLYLYF